MRGSGPAPWLEAVPETAEGSAPSLSEHVPGGPLDTTTYLERCSVQAGR